LSFLLYKMSAPDLDALAASLAGGQSSLSGRAKALRGPLLKSRQDAVSALAYLGFAKRVEPIARAQEADRSWDAVSKPAPPQVESAARAARLIEDGRGSLKKGAAPFLERRYHFQILRLLFYSGKYDECISYYEEHRTVFSAADSIRYRAMDLAAGSLYHKEDFSKADYLYSLIFDRCPPLKKSALRSFHPQEEADWRQTLALACDKHETAILWQMFGIRTDGLRAIAEIRAIDPKSRLLPLLLVREVNKAEEGASLSSYRRTVNEERAPVQRVSPELLAQICKIADAGDADKPYLWHLALAHLLALDADAPAAQARLGLAFKSMGRDASAREQARRTLLFARIRGLAAADKNLEGYFAAELSRLKSPPDLRAEFLSDWAFAALGNVYDRSQDLVRSLMLADVPTADLYQDNEKVDGFIALLKRPGKSAFDQFVAGHYGYDAGQLMELEALNHLYSGRIRQAAEAFSRAKGPAAEKKLLADPFLIHINDCHDCDFEAPKKTEYTKPVFVRRLYELEQKAQGTGEPAAQASFELANGLYNMSYFGNARDVYETGHGNFADLPRNMDMAAAEKYYQRALQLSSDREFQATAAFMAAKAEHNRLYASAAGSVDYELGKYFEKNGIPAGRYYELLRKSYWDTKYYSEIIEECGYFKSWVKKRNRKAHGKDRP